MSKRILIVRADDWEALYVDGKCVDQGHSLGEGRGLLWFLREKAKQYTFGLEDIEEVYVDDSYEEVLDVTGGFPEDLELLKEYL